MSHERKREIWPKTPAGGSDIHGTGVTMGDISEEGDISGGGVGAESKDLVKPEPRSAPTLTNKHDKPWGHEQTLNPLTCCREACHQSLCNADTQ